MKITKVKAVNFMGVVNIDTMLDKHVNKVTGKNGAGKSSFKDSIIATLCGSKYTPDVPIRTGQNKAEVVVDMGDYIVKGTYTKDGRKIEVSSPDGASYKRPQELLDKAIGKLSFDPTEFYRQSAKEQVETLRVLVGLDVKDIEAKYQTLQVERAQINSNKNILQQKCDAIVVPPDTPDEEISMVDLAKELQEANDHNIERTEIVGKIETMANAAAVNIEEAQIACEDIAKYRQLMDEAAEKERRIRQTRSETLELKAKLEQTLQPPKDVVPVQAKIAAAETTNHDVGQKKAKDELQEAIDLKTTTYTELGRDMKALDASKSQRLSAVKMPVNGLSLTEEYVTYGDLPLKQVNTGEQLKIAVAIAMAMNPKLKTVFVKCNDLDEESMKLLEQMIVKHDYQGFFEIVDSSGEVGIVIEDGMIKQRRIQPKKQPKKKVR